ncbi:MAG: GNAT family N-acetyltransferase [Pseudohongiella sp.]|nr:GNAT family N-acetyltransferase [Pseudohongiella sp.]
MIPEFEPTFPEHGEELVRIRIAAMHESLTKVGRFDPDRVRERFVSGFNPEYTSSINVSGLRVGFVVVKPEASGLKLDHLYIEPEYQGRGIGGKVLEKIFATADQLGLTISVMALRDSESNSFYQKHGFVFQDETGWDINYIRKAYTH